jgi:hypothetical protein
MTYLVVTGIRISGLLLAILLLLLMLISLVSTLSLITSCFCVFDA